MDILEFLEITARESYTGDTNKMNILFDRARKDVATYNSESKGIKGLYYKIHSRWFFGLCLIFLQPFLSSWLLAKRQNLVNRAMGKAQSFDDDDLDDLDDSEFDEYDEEEFQRLQKIRLARKI